jgi:hypothetical protein
VNQKKRKPGRPKLPKGEAKGKIVPARFAADRIKAVGATHIPNCRLSKRLTTNASPPKMLGRHRRMVAARLKTPFAGMGVRLPLPRFYASNTATTSWG